MSVGVAISTTGDPHRMPLLEWSVIYWDRALSDMDTDTRLCVTVDGDELAWQCVYKAVSKWTSSVWRVGQTAHREAREGRLGVAVNKNTGIEALMDNTPVEHLFLSDDDSWPLGSPSLDLHTNLPMGHSMVAWGSHRRGRGYAGFVDWSWPRGSVLYVSRNTVEKVGGMIEAFGPGGHEHVEWSRRIHQADLTPVLYPSPAEYAEQNCTGANRYWHCEDQPRNGETRARLLARRRELTSVRRRPEDARLQDRIMASTDGATGFVPYRAAKNGRSSAILSPIV